MGISRLQRFCDKWCEWAEKELQQIVLQERGVEKDPEGNWIAATPERWEHLDEDEEPALLAVTTTAPFSPPVATPAETRGRLIEETDSARA